MPTMFTVSLVATGITALVGTDNLPRLVDIEVTIYERDEHVRPSKIEAALTIQQRGREDQVVISPATRSQ